MGSLGGDEVDRLGLDYGAWTGLAGGSLGAGVVVECLWGALWRWEEVCKAVLITNWWSDVGLGCIIR